MRPIAAVFTSLPLFLSAIVHGQAPQAFHTPPYAPPAKPVVVVELPSQNCPIQMSARRWAGGSIARAGDAILPATPPEHGIYLHSAPSPVAGTAGQKPGAILSMVVVLHGAPRGAHMDWVDAAELNGGHDRTETFQLAGIRRNAHGDWKLTTKDLSAVREIDVVEIQFAGYTWHSSATSHCRAEPDGFLPVAQ